MNELKEDEEFYISNFLIKSKTNSKHKKFEHQPQNTKQNSF